MSDFIGEQGYDLKLPNEFVPAQSAELLQGRWLGDIMVGHANGVVSYLEGMVKHTRLKEQYGYYEANMARLSSHEQRHIILGFKTATHLLATGQLPAPMLDQLSVVADTIRTFFPMHDGRFAVVRGEGITDVAYITYLMTLATRVVQDRPYVSETDTLFAGKPPEPSSWGRYLFIQGTVNRLVNTAMRKALEVNAIKNKHYDELALLRTAIFSDLELVRTNQPLQHTIYQGNGPDSAESFAALPSPL